MIQYLDAPYGKRNSWPEICGETTSEVDFSRERTSECILMVFLVLASQGDVQVPQLLVFGVCEIHMVRSMFQKVPMITRFLGNRASLVLYIDPFPQK